MKVVVTHTHFAQYWRARLCALAAILDGPDIELVVLEMTGDGQSYESAESSFDACGAIRWIRVFGSTDVRAISPAEMSRRLFESLEAIDADVVMAVAIAFTPGATAVRWCRQRRRGVVIMDDARAEDVPRSRIVDAIKQRIYRNVDAMLIPASSHLAGFTRFGIREDAVFYGVDVIDNEWCASTADRYRSTGHRELLGRNLPDRYFLGVGRQVRKKNWRTLIDAYAAYRSASVGEAWDLVLVGDGDQRHDLELCVQASHVAGVHFLPFLDPEQVCLCYANAGCVVLPSFYGETWGLVVNEALACGVPVLVSRECGCAETLVKPDQNGWTFSPHDAKELSCLLSRFANLPQAQRDGMGDCSRRIIAGWPVTRFATAAAAAIDSCKDSRRGFAAPVDRLLLSCWKGRFRPT